MNKTAAILTRLKKYPCGLWLFSRLICFKAPYFASIKPLFIKLEPGHAEALLKKRRAVENHIGTVHAIAMANLCELVAGTMLEITLPSTHRWIPKGMKIAYLAKANTDVRATTSVTLDSLPDAGSINVLVNVTDNQGTVVVTADIDMYITKKNTPTKNVSD